MIWCKKKNGLTSNEAIMIPDLKFFSSPNGLYAISSFAGNDNLYEVDSLNGLSRDILVSKENLEPISPDSVCELIGADRVQAILKNWAFIYIEYENALQAICKATGGNAEQLVQGIFSLDCERITTLDLSGCGIKILPPQIKLFKQLSELNLRGNDFDSLPSELEDLPLKKIDLTGNLRLMATMPRWIYDRDFVILPDGLTALKKDNSFKPSSLMGKIV